jgi:hypothetical protein
MSQEKVRVVRACSLRWIWGGRVYGRRTEGRSRAEPRVGVRRTRSHNLLKGG